MFLNLLWERGTNAFFKLAHEKRIVFASKRILSKMFTEVYLVNSRISTSVYATKLFV